MQRLVTLVVLVASALVVVAGPSWAQNTSGGATTDRGGYTPRAHADDNSPPQSSGPQGTPVSHDVSLGATTCTAGGVTGPITAVPLSDQRIEDAFTHHAQWLRGHDQPGTYYDVFCGGQFLNVEWVPDGSPPPGAGGPVPAPIDPRAIAQDAIDHMPLPTPVINFNPTGDQLVNLPTWLWIDAAGMQVPPASATAGPVTVTVTATAVRVRWDMGTGDVVTCAGPGTPWTQGQSGPSPDCGYTYKKSSASQPSSSYTVTATVDWTATFSVNGAPGGGPLPGLQRTASRQVRVAEAQAVNTP